MLKEGDYIVCKKDYYDGDHINYDGSMDGISYMKKILKKPIFKNGVKYKIEKISETVIPAGGTSGTYNNSNHTPQYYHYKIYQIVGFIIGLSERDIEILFYTKKEERALKLKKLKQKSL